MYLRGSEKTRTFYRFERLKQPLDLMQKFPIERELVAYRETASPQAELSRVASGSQQRSAIQGPRKKEMDGRAGSSPRELNLQRRNGTTAGFQRCTQNRFPGGRDRERLKASASGLLKFHGYYVSVRRKPRRLRLIRCDRPLPKFPKPRKRVGHRSGRFPANQKRGRWRKPRRRIHLLRRINRRFDSTFLHAIPVWVDRIRVAMLGAGRDAERRFRLLPEKYHDVHLRPR